MKKIMASISQACKTYNLINAGDKICVGLSGGKDSLVLLSALKKLQRRIKDKFDLVAVTIDLSGGKQDWSKIEKFCNDLDVPLHIETTDIFEIVFDVRKEKNPCSLCAKMRKGVLYSKAKQLGCNKVAFAHHADDLIETMFMSMMYEGRLSTFKPQIYLSRSDIMLIRPMILTFESDILQASINMPIQKNPCPMDKTSVRQTAKNLVAQMSEASADAKIKMLRAIISPDRYDLFDN